MAERNPFETSYAEHVPKLSESISRNAAKRLRKEAGNRGARQRQEFEAKAPYWKNEPSELQGTQNAPAGHSVDFQPGSNPGPLRMGYPGATTKPRKGK